jgi:outer membrane protein assembly factor BamC
MQYYRSLYWICLGLLIIGTSGCSTIKSWFPDKERDYQFTAEIPEMIVPDDLKAGGMAMSAVSQAPAAVEAESVVAEPAKVTAQSPTKAAAKGATKAESIVTAKKSASSVSSPEEAVASEPASPGSSLQIDQPQNQAAHIVSKALSRQKLEITERNVDKGYFFVKFDPKAVQVEDKSWLDELNFVFGDEPSHEREYRIHLRELNPQLTEVTVQDSVGKTQSSDSANALLKLITDAINQDIAAPETPKSADANGEAKPKN